MNYSSFAPVGYEIIRSLGCGGTAQVYLVRSAKGSSLLAMKAPLELNPIDLSTFASLIRREFQLIGKNRYPGFVRVFEMSETNQPVPYMTMEYIPGITLDQIDKIDDWRSLAYLLSSISMNLFYLRLLGIAHGDIKPHNIFLPAGIGDFGKSQLPYSKISDFSLALKEGEASSDRLGQGTIGYMAPEMIDKGELTHQSDIFALGVMAYRLATGKHPFIENDTDPVRINAMVKEHHPDPPSRLAPLLPQQMDDLIMAMLRKNPQERPVDGWSICEELEKIGSNYLYKKAIRPKHLLYIGHFNCASLILDLPIFNFGKPIIERLLDYCDDDIIKLRNILEINFTRNHLVWQGGRLSFNGSEEEIILPKKIRNQVRYQFQHLPYQTKKVAIRSAVASSLQRASQIGLLSSTINDGQMTRSLIYQLRQHISQSTLKRLSIGLAERAVLSPHNNLLASQLYIQSGKLEPGFTKVWDTINELLNDNLHDSAFELMDGLIDLCRIYNETEKLKIVLMKYADTLRQTGDTIRAEKIYNRIIGLYQDDKTDNLLGETYKDLGDLYKTRLDYQAGINALEKAEQIYSGLGDLLEVSHTHNNIGNIYVVNNQFEKAYQSFRQALHIQKKLRVIKDIASTLNNMGVVFYMKGKYGRVIRLFTIAIDINRQLGNMQEMARALNNRGLMYNVLGRFDDALEDLRESLDINRKIGSKKEILYNLENFTQIMISAGRLKESLGYLREGMLLADELSDYPHRCNFSGNTGIVQKRLGQYGKAMKNIKQAINLSGSLADKRDFVLWFINLADLYLRLNDRNQALNAAKKALEEAQKSEDKKAIIHIYALLGLIEGNQEWMEKAERMADEIKAVRDLSLVRLKRVYLQLSVKNDESAGMLLQILKSDFIEGNSDIENAEFYILCGKYNHDCGDRDKALHNLLKGHQIAAKLSLLPESIEASIHLGIMYAEKMEYESAYNYYRSAINGLKTIANDIRDETLRTSFLSNEKIAFVSGEVKQLRQFLAKK
jgi:serine/threonine protein kinase/Tfp pilus assembly protein PilF